MRGEGVGALRLRPGEGRAGDSALGSRLPTTGLAWPGREESLPESLGKEPHS